MCLADKASNAFASIVLFRARDGTSNAKCLTGSKKSNYAMNVSAFPCSTYMNTCEDCKVLDIMPKQRDLKRGREGNCGRSWLRCLSFLRRLS